MEGGELSETATDIVVEVLRMCATDISMYQPVIQVSNEKNLGWLGYTRDYVTTQLYRDYFINHEIRIPINQPGFHGK